MTPNPGKFAQLLTEGIHRIRIREEKTIQAIQDELGYALGRQGGSSIEYWRKGHLPPKLTEVEDLAKQLVRRGQLERTWLGPFLSSAGHPAWEQLTDEMLVKDSKVVQAGPHPGRIPDPAPLPAGSRMPFSKNPLFVGREADLKQLADVLYAGSDVAVNQVETTATMGLGGIGKTQLASEFVHRYGQFFNGGVFWLSLADPQSVMAEIANCGGAGGMNLHPEFGARPLEDQVRLVQAAWQEPVPRLLVFDNCEDPELLVRWRPTTGGCRVLVTSRRGDWDAVLGVQAVTLGVLSRSESLALLVNHCPDVDGALLDAIAEELGDLPLALHLAGSYLHRYRRVVAPAVYLEQLRDPKLLHHPSMQGLGISPTGHMQNVGRSFALSYDQLDPEDTTDAVAMQLLVHAAHFAPGEPIWYDLLIKTLDVSVEDSGMDLLVENAFSRLIELGLIELVEDDILRMHRLIAAFVRDVAKDAVEATQTAVETIVFEETERINREGYPMPLLAWQLHLRSVVDIAQAREDERSANLCTELGQHLWQIGDFQGARPYLKKALDIKLALYGEQNLTSAEGFTNMGVVLRDLGEIEQGRNYLERALTVQEEMLGGEHANIAHTLNHLGWLLLLEGNGDQSRQCLERALQIAESLYGEQHKLTADYANNLGLCLQDCLSDSLSALPYMKRALLIRIDVFGEEHPLTAISYNNVGHVMHALKKLDDARAYYEKALTIREKAANEDHPDTAVTLKNLGTVLRDQGDLDSAKYYLESALAIYLRVVGEQHRRTAFCLDSLGLLFQQRGELDVAQSYFERSLNVRRIVYEGDHRNIALSLFNLGVLLQVKGELDGARKCLEDALAIHQRTLGNDHVLTAKTMIKIGELFYAQDNISAARKRYQNALDIYEHICGSEDLELENLHKKISMLSIE